MRRCLWSGKQKWSVILIVFLLSNASVWGATKIIYMCDATGVQSHTFRISIQMETADRPSVDFQMPAWNALYQIRDFAYRVHEVRAFDLKHGVLSVEKEDKQTWRVNTGGAKEVEFDYEVFADEPGPFSGQLNSHHAFINPAYIFMYPVDGKNQPLVVKFRIPQDWKIATALKGTSEARQFEARNYDELADSPVELGKFLWLQFELKGAQFGVVIDSDSVQPDREKFVSMVRRIAETETDLMQDVPFSHYTFFYHLSKEPAGGGMEHAYSTAIQINAAENVDYMARLRGITAHEFFHLWNVKRIRPAALQPIDYTKENYSRSLWFSEGVTSLYGAYTLVRSGLVSKEEFYQSLAETIQRFESRPAHLVQSAEESSVDSWLEKYSFYRRPDHSISYYDKGEIIGLLLDLQIREATQNRKSLDDVLRYLNVEVAKKGRFFDDRTGIAGAVEAVTGRRFEEFFARYVRGIEEIDYDYFLNSAGLSLKRETRPVGDPGFFASIGNDGSARIEAVSEGGPAARAGLRQEDEIMKLNGRLMTRSIAREMQRIPAGQKLQMRIRREGREQDIAFQVGTRNVTEYSIDENPTPSALQAVIRSGILTGK